MSHKRALCFKWVNVFNYWSDTSSISIEILITDVIDRVNKVNFLVSRIIPNAQICCDFAIRLLVFSGNGKRAILNFP